MIEVGMRIFAFHATLGESIELLRMAVRRHRLSVVWALAGRSGMCDAV